MPGKLENRKNQRFKSLASARLPGVCEGDLLLKDISILGCCVESPIFIDVRPGIQYKMEIVPEKAAKIGSFEMVIESRWVHSQGYSCEVGFAIVESPKGKLFQRYVDYLSWRSERSDPERHEAGIS
jgi:hypothetical protein